MPGTDTESYTPPAPFAPRGLRELKSLLVSSKPSDYLKTYTKWTRENFDAERWQWVATKAFFLKLQTSEEGIDDDDLKLDALEAIGADVGMHALRASEELHKCARIFGATCGVVYTETSKLPPSNVALYVDAVAYYDDYAQVEQERFGCSRIQFPPDFEADVLDLSELCIDSANAYKLFRKSISESTKRYFDPRHEGFQSELTEGMTRMFNRRVARSEAALDRAAINFGFAVELRKELGYDVRLMKKLELSAIAYFEADKLALAGTKRLIVSDDE